MDYEVCSLEYNEMKRLDKPAWQKKREKGKKIWLGLLGAFLLIPLVAGLFFVFKNAFNESEITVSGTQIFVKAGGDLQAAVNRAKAGDTIVLQAGAKFVGTFVLPKKEGAEFITIQSSDAAKLPKDGERVSLNDAALMPKILTSGKGEPAIRTVSGAHHYRFVGIEFAPANNDYIYNLVYLGEEEGKTGGVPHHIEIEHCYLHSNLPGVTRRGIALNSADTIVKDSYLAGFAGNQEETQGICGWSGTKNAKIINNYIEGGAENILFGGADPATADLIPQDIEIRGNYINKPAEWKNKYTYKCLFELKNAKRVQFTDNYLANNWLGSALRVTVRNQSGTAPFSTIEDVVIKANIIDGAGEGVNILGTDDANTSQTLKNLTITNNLFLKIGDAAYAGSGYFIQVSGGENILIANNTAFNEGSPIIFYGQEPRNFLFRDNIAGHGSYGFHGHENIKSPAGQKLVQNNIIVNNKKVSQYDSSYPPNNSWVQSYNEVGFVNFGQNDFRLAPSSRFKGKGKDKGDIGSNLVFKKP